MEKKSSFFPFPSWQANLPIHDDVSTMALYSSWGWWENPVNKQKPFPLTAKSSSTGSRTSQSSCSPVPYPPSSASDLRIFANISVCCFYKESEFSDFDITPYNIMYFLILFWMIILVKSVYLLTFFLCRRQPSLEEKRIIIIMMGLPWGISFQNCQSITWRSKSIGKLFNDY